MSRRRQRAATVVARLPGRGARDEHEAGDDDGMDAGAGDVMCTLGE